MLRSFAARFRFFLIVIVIHVQRLYKDSIAHIVCKRKKISTLEGVAVEQFLCVTHTPPPYVYRTVLLEHWQISLLSTANLLYALQTKLSLELKAKQ